MNHLTIEELQRGARVDEPGYMLELGRRVMDMYVCDSLIGSRQELDAHDESNATRVASEILAEQGIKTKLLQVKEMPQNQSFITAWMYNGQLWSELNIFEEGFVDGVYVLKRHNEEADEFIEIVNSTPNPDTEYTYYIQD